MLYNKSLDLYYATILAEPSMLLPVVYTPTVGEACQKFGLLPHFPRGCYISVSDRGRVRNVLEEYALAELTNGADGTPQCDCIVFSDGGRILGLGDLGAWGMGIPIGKLDLYTVCGGVNPHRTIPLIIDAGCYGPHGNTDGLVIRDHPLYTGLKQERVTTTSTAGTQINAAYYGEQSLIGELFEAATSLFGRNCLLQFEDFNSNDAFPLLAEYRNKYLTYNDDIQGTAAVALAAIMGAIKLRTPGSIDLVGALASETFLFHGAGSANLGTAALLRDECGVPAANIFLTNSRGVIWVGPDGKGNFRNAEQRALATLGPLPFASSASLAQIIEAVQPSCLIGAVGRDPGCFTHDVVRAMLRVNGGDRRDVPRRPVIFALSNPKSQAEISAADAYSWSEGAVIYGSGTAFPLWHGAGGVRTPGQVNNVYIFPGVSFAAISCEAHNLPERIFLIAAQAVANSLDDADIAADAVVPNRNRIRQVSLNVAVAVCLEAQKLGLAGKVLGDDAAAVEAALKQRMWSPPAGTSRL